MWIFMRDGFVSVVKAEDRVDGMLMIRSRSKVHLAQCFPLLKDCIETTKDRDYRFRTYCHKDFFAHFMGQQIRDIDYTNFKNSVAEQHPKKGILKTLYKRALTGIWYEMLVFQETLYGGKESVREESSANHNLSLVPKIKRRPAARRE